jgi:hypothetical protein
MDHSKLKALILDANPAIHQTYRDALASDFILLQAQTIGEAEQFFLAHCNDLHLIIVDGFPIQHIPIGPMLVRIVRKTKSTVYVMGVSSIKRDNDQLFDAGCDTCFPDQNQVIRFIRAMLDECPAGSNPFKRDAPSAPDRSKLSGAERLRQFQKAHEPGESSDPSRSDK